LDAFKKLSVCTAYRINGKESGEVPFQITRVNIEPVYKVFEGWDLPTDAAKLPEDLPEAMKKYVDFINRQLGVSIQYISNGPGREQIVALFDK
jgi:adenylosuccinate synthase